MTHQFETRRCPATNVRGMYEYDETQTEIVFSGEIKRFDSPGARIVKNHLAMRSDTKYNGTVGTHYYWVHWVDKTPRGPNKKLFNYLYCFKG